MATLAVTIGRGTLAARPATMPAGSLYYVTDTSTLYRSNGATWDQIEAAAAAAYTDEQARDAIGAALVAGSGITVTVNDPSDTITVAATGTVIGTHTHVGADVTDFAEVTDDRLNALLVAGSGITLTYNDAANTLTVASSVSAGAPPHPRWVTGRYYGIQEIGRIQFTGGSLLTANRLYLTPLMVPAAVTVDRIGVQVTAAAATTNVRLGIYGDFSAAGSAALLLDAGTVDSSTTGGKELTISQALSAGGQFGLGLVWAQRPQSKQHRRHGDRCRLGQGRHGRIYRPALDLHDCWGDQFHQCARTDGALDVRETGQGKDGQHARRLLERRAQAR
jgi:hypothetical protein